MKGLFFPNIKTIRKAVLKIQVVAEKRQQSGSS